MIHALSSHTACAWCDTAEEYFFFRLSIDMCTTFCFVWKHYIQLNNSITPSRVVCTKCECTRKAQSLMAQRRSTQPRLVCNTSQFDWNQQPKAYNMMFALYYFRQLRHFGMFPSEVLPKSARQNLHLVEVLRCDSVKMGSCHHNHYHRRNSQYVEPMRICGNLTAE